MHVKRYTSSFNHTHIYIYIYTRLNLSHRSDRNMATLTQNCIKSELCQSCHEILREIRQDFDKCRPSVAWHISYAWMPGRSWNVVFHMPKWPAEAGTSAEAGMSYFVSTSGWPKLGRFLRRPKWPGKAETLYFLSPELARPELVGWSNPRQMADRKPPCWIENMYLYQCFGARLSVDRTGSCS